MRCFPQQEAPAKPHSSGDAQNAQEDASSCGPHDEDALLSTLGAPVIKDRWKITPSETTVCVCACNLLTYTYEFIYVYTLYMYIYFRYKRFAYVYIHIAKQVNI